MGSWSNRELLELCKSKLSDTNNLVAIEQSVFAIPERLKLISTAIDQLNSILQNTVRDLGESDTILIEHAFGAVDNKVHRKLSAAREQGLIFLDFIIQSLHCCAELLAHLINLILLNDKKNHYLFTIFEKLSKSGEHPKLAKEIRELLDCDSFKYIAAYTNESKHRQLIKVKHTADINDYLVISEFTRRGEKFAKKWNSDITKQVVEDIRPKIVRIGNQINKSVSQLTSALNVTKTVG